MDGSNDPPVTSDLLWQQPGRGITRMLRWTEALSERTGNGCSWGGVSGPDGCEQYIGYTDECFSDDCRN